MPIISKIGSRSLKVRLVYGAMFLVLIIGAATMVYPLLLMLCGSVKSQADIMNISPWPMYWFNDLPLFQKYTESKYNVQLKDVEKAWHQTVHLYDKIEKPSPCDEQLLDSFMIWREKCPWWKLGHAYGGSLMRRLLPENGRKFRKLMFERFSGNLNTFNTQMAMPLKSWSDVWPPIQGVFRYPRPREGLMSAFLDFAEIQPVRDRIIPNLDAEFWKLHLVPEYTNDIKQYNEKHGPVHQADLETAAPNFTDNRHTYLIPAAVLNSILLSFCSCITVNPTSIEPRIQAMAVATPNRK